MGPWHRSVYLFPGSTGTLQGAKASGCPGCLVVWGMYGKPPHVVICDEVQSMSWLPGRWMSAKGHPVCYGMSLDANGFKSV